MINCVYFRIKFKTSVGYEKIFYINAVSCYATVELKVASALCMKLLFQLDTFQDELIPMLFKVDVI